MFSGLEQYQQGHFFFEIVDNNLKFVNMIKATSNMTNNSNN